MLHRSFLYIIYIIYYIYIKIQLWYIHIWLLHRRSYGNGWEISAQQKNVLLIYIYIYINMYIYIYILKIYINIYSIYIYLYYKCIYIYIYLILESCWDQIFKSKCKTEIFGNIYRFLLCILIKRFFLIYIKEFLTN